MLIHRSLTLAARRIANPRVVFFTTRRTFISTVVRAAGSSFPASNNPEKKLKSFAEVKTEEDLLAPGAAPGAVPTDLEHATGLERLEILGKMEGVDIFDMKPLDASRRGTFDNPITVQSFGEEQYLGCTGSPADSHTVTWLTVSHDRPFERCPECGSVYKMEYLGTPIGAHDDHHHDPHHTVHKDPETMADYVKPEYWGHGIV